MRRLNVLLAAATLAALAGCAPRAAMHDKAYYAAHPRERASAIAVCKDHPGGLGGEPDCTNAQAADADAHADHFYDAPRPASRVQAPGQL